MANPFEMDVAEDYLVILVIRLKILKECFRVSGLSAPGCIHAFITINRF